MPTDTLPQTVGGLTLNRLDEIWFLTFVGLAVAFCLVHAARRAFRQPLPTAKLVSRLAAGSSGAADGNGHARLGRYSLVQRIFHWLNLASVIMLLLSGLAIYAPKWFSAGQPAAFWFKWHGIFVAIFIGAALFHIIYDNLILDRFANMWFGRDEQGRTGAAIRNFLGMSKEYPRYTKYHPAQILYHWAMAGSLVLLTLSGMVLWLPLRSLLPYQMFGLGQDFVYFNRIIHDFFTFSVAALVIGHAYFGIFIKKNWAESWSMVEGTVPLDEYLHAHEEPPREALGGAKEVPALPRVPVEARRS